MTTTKLARRRARWIIHLEPYNFSIIYRTRRKYNNADSLSQMHKPNKLLKNKSLFDLPTEQEAFEATLEGNLITFSDDEVEILYLENKDNELENLWSKTVSLLEEQSEENNNKTE